jgi:hypothetical protein
MPAALTKSEVATVSPLSPNTLRILVLNAGLGADSILINASNITALEQTGAGNRARVDGGGGVDTLKLDGAGVRVSLPAPATKISSLWVPVSVLAFLSPR